MVRFSLSIAAVAIVLATPASAQGAILGPDARACSPGSSEPAVLVKVNGLKARTGKVRVQLYGSDPAKFLASGGRLKRIDLPVTRSGPMQVCVALPKAGRYAVAVRHDVNGNGKKGDWNDGGGFSRNPKVSLLDLKPSYGEVAIPVGNGVKPVDVTLLYRNGLSIGPARS